MDTKGIPHLELRGEFESFVPGFGVSGDVVLFFGVWQNKVSTPGIFGLCTIVYIHLTQSLCRSIRPAFLASGSSQQILQLAFSSRTYNISDSVLD